MEELRKLEEVERMLELMQSKSVVSTSNAHSDRFLASLLLLLINPCANLDIAEKYTLITEHVPKISVSFLEEASFLFNPTLSGCGETSGGHVVSSLSNKISKNKLESGNFEDMAVVSLDSMQRANSTLEDFCRSYFMFHKMDINSLQAIFKFLPVLSFTESYIYQMDSLNEKIVNLSTNRDGVVERENEMWEGNEIWIKKCMYMLKTDPFRPLVAQLECHGLLTERILEELGFGEEYWSLERKLCTALIRRKEISIEDVMRAISLKSFDYRILNLLMYQLRGEKVNELHMGFLSISEFLVEVSDDLFDYEDDVIENNFNILRMFVGIYGPSTAPIMLAKRIAEAEEKYDILLKTLDPQLSLNYQKRCQEATKEGGKITGHPFGTWNIPPVIVNEELHRMSCLNSNSIMDTSR